VIFHINSEISGKFHSLNGYSSFFLNLIVTRNGIIGRLQGSGKVAGDSELNMEFPKTLLVFNKGFVLEIPKSTFGSALHREQKNFQPDETFRPD